MGFWGFRCWDWAAAAMGGTTCSPSWPPTRAEGAYGALVCSWECVCFVREAHPAHGECINAPAPLAIPSFSLSLTVTQHLPYPSSYPPPAPPYSPSPPPYCFILFYGTHLIHTDRPKKKKMRNGRGEAEINVLISNRIPVFGLKVPWDWMKIKTQKQTSHHTPPKKFIIECTCVLKGNYLGEEKKPCKYVFPVAQFCLWMCLWYLLVIV